MSARKQPIEEPALIVLVALTFMPVGDDMVRGEITLSADGLESMVRAVQGHAELLRPAVRALETAVMEALDAEEVAPPSPMALVSSKVGRA